ncbi:MAG: hypothetical protein H7Y33_04705 [Cytophagales bacterium]|nr:hypothetical protein [Rhizobacter sp.]
MMLIPKSICVALVSVVLTGLAGCEGLEGARIRDQNSPTVSVRATFRPEVLSRGRSEGGIEVGYERYRANDTQQLGAGQHVDVGTQHISGPDSLHNQVTVQQGHLAYAQRISFGSHFRLEPRLGVSRMGTDLTVEPTVSTQRAQSQRWGTRFFYGITPSWRFNDVLALEARVTGSNGGAMRTYAFDAGLLVSPVPGASLRLGYSERRHTGYVPDSLSELDIRVRGPSASLVFDF